MIISQTPLRISFFGGNTDFKEYYLEHGGIVLTATIDKYIYCIVKKRFDNLIVVNYSQKEIVTNIKELKHDLVREALKLLNIRRGIEISFLADIPSEGTGLGSSSSVLVGVLNALHAYRGEGVSSWQLAEEAVKIEVDILKKHIGVQDQYAVALGGLREISFKTNGEVRTRIPRMKQSIREDFNNSLMLFYTGVTRKTDDVLSYFNVNHNLRGLDQKKLLAIGASEKLIDGDLGEFGKMLGESWNDKKRANIKTTSSEIDLMYDKAIEGGILGGKVIGAGGGGFLLVMFPANKRESVSTALKEYKEMPFRFNNFGSRIIFNL